MKKLNFVFKNGDVIIYDIVVDYELVDGYICFSYDKSDYKVILDKDFEFRRLSDDTEFLLEVRNDKATSKVILKDENITVDVGVTHFTYKNEKDEYTIVYGLESDEDSLKKDYFDISAIRY